MRYIHLQKSHVFIMVTEHKYAPYEANICVYEVL